MLPGPITASLVAVNLSMIHLTEWKLISVGSHLVGELPSTGEDRPGGRSSQQAEGNNASQFPAHMSSAWNTATPRGPTNLAHIVRSFLELESREPEIPTAELPAPPAPETRTRSASRPGRDRVLGPTPPQTQNSSWLRMLIPPPAPPPPPATWVDVALAVSKILVDLTAVYRIRNANAREVAPTVVSQPAQLESPDIPGLMTIKQLADDAALDLELFSKSLPEDETATDHHHQALITRAAGRILNTHKRVQLNSEARNAEDRAFDATCVVCYTDIANIVFMPCKHLAVCEVSFSWVRGNVCPVGQRANERGIDVLW